MDRVKLDVSFQRQIHQVNENKSESGEINISCQNLQSRTYKVHYYTPHHRQIVGLALNTVYWAVKLLLLVRI